ncbi:putative transposase [Alicyclobacillus sacchari]|uniref:Putative transposase n=1 Tax=Alicyclobacillus sacchari TaxID=392010 RepID=A0A4R8L3Q0_9BACL|nr:IS3 family transposase [Alicyclobacillus sacchari]TDY37197.1 putative transposase [Alicyclobacillus sacchari]
MVAQLVKEGFRVPVIAKALELNRTYCYSLLKEPVKKANKAVIEKDALLKQRIRHLCERFPRYGYRRIKVMLRRQYSMQVNHKRVHRLMREMGLLVKSPQREASRKKRSGKIPVSQSNEHFQCDMTKIWCGKDGWGYLFAVIDAYDREIVGYSFSRYCRTEELLQAVDNAFNYRFPSGVRGANLTLRTDNGCQMTSRRFVQAMKDCQVKHERTGYHNPDADGYIERFFRSLKEEEVWMQEYDNFAEAKIAIKTYIEFYNKERPHSALGYRTPQEFRKWKESKEAA